MWGLIFCSIISTNSGEQDGGGVGGPGVHLSP